jgi:two-component system, LytTR family, sensor kinase
MPNLRRLATIWLAWTVAGLFYFTQDFVPRLYRNEAVPWREVFIGWMAAMYICAAFTPGILWLGRRWPLGHGPLWKWASLHLAFSTAFSLVSTSIEAPVLSSLGVLPPPLRASLWTALSWLLVYSFHGGVIRYWAVIALQAVVRYQDQARQREREALAAQLGALKTQLQPHFLFNTLGAIMALVRQSKNRDAEAMIGRLSDLLRLTLEDVHAHEVPLWRELEFLRLYLSIEQVRFSDRLRVDIAAGPELADAFVPHMLLQPIVENAVRHGLGQSEQAVCIHVEASKIGDDLVLTVTDDGPGSPSGGFAGKGIGLANTRNRLDRLYGPRASLAARNRAPHGVQVIVTLPFHLGRSEDAECP